MTDSERLSVVLADDLEDVRFLVRRFLERSGRFVVVGEADDGRQAVALASKHLPDLVLLDLAMPEMDALQALPLIRRASPSSVVVVLSSFVRQRMAEPVVNAGAAGYIEKGLDPENFIARLLSIMEDPPDAAVARAAHREDGGPGDERTGGADDAVVRMVLDKSRTSPRDARQFVQQTLSEWQCDHLTDVTTLLTSELVTNAVVHADSELVLSMELREGFLRVEVHDHSARGLVLRNQSEESINGRGLAIIDALAELWGTEPTDTGKLVWFELPNGRTDRR